MIVKYIVIILGFDIRRFIGFLFLFGYLIFLEGLFVRFGLFVVV